MKRERIIKKAMIKLSGQFEILKKNLLEYIRSDAKEIFDTSDVKISGRITWDKQEEDYELEDMEIDSASIEGFAHTLLHDLYEGNIPEKEQRIKDAEKLYKEFKGKTFPFETHYKEEDLDLSGKIKILETRYIPTKDTIEVTKHELIDIQVD